MTSSDLETLLHAVAEAWSVPGAQLCLTQKGTSHFAVYGHANSATQAPVTPHTRFQLGSTTKPMVSWLAHRLAEQGELDLNAPISRLLPDVQLPSSSNETDISCRMLMSHQSGLCGDAFLDLGNDFAAERRLAEASSKMPMIHPPGDDVSYCNFGYVLLGLILERISGRHWTSLFHDQITDALISTTIDPWPDFAATQNLAVGHADGAPVSRTSLAASNSAAGTTLIGTARDLSRFGELVLESFNADAPMSAVAVKAMTTPSRWLAPNERGLGFGEGLMVFRTDPLVFGHDGLTIGQQAYLRIFPETGATLAYLGNGGDMRSASAALFSALAESTGTELLPPTYSDALESDIESTSFHRPNASIEIETRATGRTLSIVNHEDWAIDLYGAREGPFNLTSLEGGGVGYFKPSSATPYRLHVSPQAAYLGMRRYNRFEGCA